MNKRLVKDIAELSRGYDSIETGKDKKGEFIAVRGFKLPPGYNKDEIEVLLYPPKDYPLSPPGLDHSLFVPKDLLYKGKMIEDFNPESNSNWAWLCFQDIKWDPKRDNLITFFEMVRTNLTFKEKTKKLSASKRKLIEKVNLAFATELPKSNGCLVAIVMALIVIPGFIFLIGIIIAAFFTRL